MGIHELSHDSHLHLDADESDLQPQALPAHVTAHTAAVAGALAGSLAVSESSSLSQRLADGDSEACATPRLAQAEWKATPASAPARVGDDTLPNSYTRFDGAQDQNQNGAFRGQIDGRGGMWGPWERGATGRRPINAWDNYGAVDCIYDYGGGGGVEVEVVGPRGWQRALGEAAAAGRGASCAAPFDDEGVMRCHRALNRTHPFSFLYV